MGSALVAVSGGVDSSVALLRSISLFDRVRAVHLDTGGTPCREAAAVSGHLGVEFTVCDASELFSREVAGPSLAMFRAGLTPNPCVLCNARVKLKIPFDMLEPDEVIVTGHYSGRTPDGSVVRGADPSRDQSYFLSFVPEEILRRCFFPLRDSGKEEVRREALTAGLPFRREESMDLCFDLWKDGDRGMPGPVVDVRLGPVGEHSGIGGFTIGQRKGIGAHGERRFVVSLEPSSGTVFIGSEEDLLSSGCTLERMNWLVPVPAGRFDAEIQTRHRRKPLGAEVMPLGEGALVRFARPEKAVAPGQAGALYQGNRLLGGGVITGVDTLEECILGRSAHR
jgi:tRNA-specific 2-thiouridylase